MTTKKLLGLRKQINAKRPEFRQQDSHKRKEIVSAWRRPKGMHSKMRHGVWGRPASVNVGYRGPAEVRGMHDSGLMPILVNTVSELTNFDAKTQGAILGHIGGRKKVDVLTACKQKGITVLNVKNVDETIQTLKDRVTARKTAKKEAEKSKAAKQKTIPKPEPKKEETPKTKEEERKEAEKVMIQKE